MPGASVKQQCSFDARVSALQAPEPEQDVPAEKAPQADPAEPPAPPAIMTAPLPEHGLDGKQPTPPLAMTAPASVFGPKPKV